MIIYDHEPLLLNDLYVYDKIRLACPLRFEPSAPGIYDIIIKDGQDLPITNGFPRPYVNEAGTYSVPDYSMTLNYVEDTNIGEYLKVKLTYQSTPIAGAEIRVYHAGTPYMVLPIYLTDDNGEAKIYLLKGSYDLLLRFTMDRSQFPEVPGPPSYCKFHCKTLELYKNFSRYINNLEMMSGLYIFDALTAQPRVPVTRYLRRVNSSGDGRMRQGNLLDRVRYDKNSDWADNVFTNGITRVFDESGVLVQTAKIDPSGEVLLWLEKDKKYVLYHDQVAFDTVYELVDTSFILGGNVPSKPVSNVLVEPGVGSTAQITVMSVDDDVKLRAIYDYVGDKGDEASAYELKLLDMSDPVNPGLLVDDLILPYMASFISGISPDASAMSFMSANLSMSWMSQMWLYYDFTINATSAMSGPSGMSAQMLVRGRNIDGAWGDYGVENFVIKE